VSAFVPAAAGPSAYWFLARGTGTVTLLLLTASVVLGVLGSVRFAAGPNWPRFTIDALHRDISLLVVALLVLHIITSVLDSFAPISLLDAVIPFRASYRPLWLGLGTLSFDVLIALIVTSLLRRRLGYRSWRAIHWLARGGVPRTGDRERHEDLVDARVDRDLRCGGAARGVDPARERRSGIGVAARSRDGGIGRGRRRPRGVYRRRPAPERLGPSRRDSHVAAGSGGLDRGALDSQAIGGGPPAPPVFGQDLRNVLADRGARRRGRRSGAELRGRSAWTAAGPARRSASGQWPLDDGQSG
jgi:hypothetical protein